jgi:2-phospho-L-lactate guanylyltransferase
MTTIAVLPIKRFEQAKSRLKLDDRGDVMREMAGEVLTALEAAEELDSILVVTADPDAVELGRTHGATVVDEVELRGHSGAAKLGIEHAMRNGAARVLLAAGDCPLLTGGEIDDALRKYRAPGVVVFPDRHGTGTNGLLLSPPDVIEPAFGPNSCKRHERRARDAGAACTIARRRPFALDIDTVDDLAALRRARA